MILRTFLCAVMSPGGLHSVLPVKGDREDACTREVPAAKSGVVPRRTGRVRRTVSAARVAGVSQRAAACDPERRRPGLDFFQFSERGAAPCGAAPWNLTLATFVEAKGIAARSAGEVENLNRAPAVVK